ncbi:DNA primase [Thalassolituus maritimus]|jgi:DNA primase|uniref:DNA primase n=1 Tax=Thalassolituus maritimus TaxID=484498 RepID=A0ABQ0A1A9_9GAMM|nr:DNA primase [Pseudomonadota bacterium]
MAGRIPQSFIDELLTRVDVVDVVDSRVKLKKTGKNYSACCPFHNENTPSFTVSPDKQFYYCFGCGASGTALRFVMEFDGLSFPDAVEKLASQASMTVPREAASQREIQQEQEHKSLFTRMEASSRFFEQQLREHEQRHRAVDYLKGRGLSGKAAKFFGIGYAPPGWDNLQESLGSDKQIIRELVTSGMLIEKEDGRTYDRFRDRIMFPIRDARGRYIAFGGRVLGDEKPKYLNSPETPIFQKNRELYGLYEARKIRQKLTRFVIVEGYMDVVALAEFGIHYAVATLGTATSEHHLRRLFKIVPEVIFCFDGDDAGRTAAARAMETALPVLSDGVQARFLFLPDGEDPDTLVRKEGRDGFEKRLNESLHLPEFLFEQLKQQVDFDTLDGKARLDKMAAPLIGKLPKGTLRSLMEKRLDDMIGTRSSAMAAVNEDTPPEPPELDDGVSMPDIITEPVPQSHAPEVEDPLATMVHRALTSLVRFPALAQSLTLPESEPETEYERLLFEVLRRLHQSPQQESIGLLIQWIGSPYEPELKALADNPESDQIRPAAADVRVVLERIAARKEDRVLEQLEARLHNGEKLDKDERAKLTELKRQRHQRNRKRTGIYQR